MKITLMLVSVSLIALLGLMTFALFCGSGGGGGMTSILVRGHYNLPP